MLTVLRSLTTAYKSMLPFSERLIWSDDFKIFGLNLPPLMQNTLWNQSEPSTAIQSDLSVFSRFYFLHRKCLNDNVTYTTRTRGNTTIYSHSRTRPWQWRWWEMMQSCFYRCIVQKTHWMLSFKSNDGSEENRYRHWLLLETSILTMWESKCSDVL